MTDPGRPALAPVRREFVDGPYGQMHIRQSGEDLRDAPPLVLLHMFPQSSSNFIPLMQRLGRTRRVIAPDFPGYGESAPPAKRISAEDYAASIWCALDLLLGEVKRDAIDLFGIHAGAKLAAEVARQRPRQVRRIMLCSAAVFTEEETEAMRRGLGKIPLDQEGTRFTTFWRMLRDYAATDMPLEDLGRSFAEMLRGGEQYWWGHAAVFDYNSRFARTLAELDHPLAILNPGDDLYEITPRAMALVPDAIYIERRDWSFGFLDTVPNEVAEVIGTFFALSEEEQANRSDPASGRKQDVAPAR